MANRLNVPNKLLTQLPRRAFLKWMGSGVLVVALAGVARSYGKERFIRPPGALPEDEFLSFCIRCDKCRNVCPYGAISPVSITESIVGIGTPKLNGYCPNCKRCIPACPTGALSRYRI
jgi:ferredoxin-type protein NapG